jgi:hypothetical protein
MNLQLHTPLHLLHKGDNGTIKLFRIEFDPARSIQRY